MARVHMYHPHAGTLECSESAARIHAKSGWVEADGVSGVTVRSADGGDLTSGTVFPPEQFDDEPVADGGDDNGPRAEPPNPTEAKP